MVSAMSMLKKITPPTVNGRSDTPINAYYELIIDSISMGSFYSISGGEIEVSVIKHEVTYESGESSTHFIPGRTRFTPIVLSKGFQGSENLYNWFVAAAKGNTYHARRNGTITLNGFVNGTYKPLVRWNLENVWPNKLSGFDMNQFNATSTARFEITLVAEVIEREDVE